LRKYGLAPLLANTGGIDFPNGIIHPEVHNTIEASRTRTTRRAW
jgi:hypothetical protein